MLKIQDLNIAFGGVLALENLSFEVEPRTITALIGPNGAGKTTALNCISQYIQPTNGLIRYNGISLVGKSAHDIIRRGIARTFQHLELFNSMTVLDNLLVAQHVLNNTPWLYHLLPLPSFRRRHRGALQSAREVMRFLDLMEFEEWPAGALAYGVRKRLDLARAIVTKPSLILLDEPAAGLSPREIEEVSRQIQRIRSELGTTLLLVEHHMDLVMDVCDKVVVLNFGKKLAEGTPKEIQEHPMVLDAYLGKGRA